MSLIKWAGQDKVTLVYATVSRTFYSRSELCNMLRVINSAEVTIIEYIRGVDSGIEVVMRVGLSAHANIPMTESFCLIRISQATILIFI